MLMGKSCSHRVGGHSASAVKQGQLRIQRNFKDKVEGNSGTHTTAKKGDAGTVLDGKMEKMRKPVHYHIWTKEGGETGPLMKDTQGLDGSTLHLGFT